MSESDIDTDRMMQGVDCEVKTITWTKCSDRMPGNSDLIVIKNNDSNEVFEYTGIRLRMYFDSFCDMNAKVKAILNTSWTYYTPEAWKELNKK